MTSMRDVRGPGDITNLVKKMERGSQLLFDARFLEKSWAQEGKREIFLAKEVRSVKEAENLRIEYNSWEKCCIDRVVKEEEIRDDLEKILIQNRLVDSLVYYTDGSLISKKERDKMKIGYEIVHVNKEGHVIRKFHVQWKSGFYQQEQKW